MGNENPQAVDWSKDPYWQNRRFSPAQILIHDFRLTENPFHPQTSSTFLEINECFTSTLVPDLKDRDNLSQRFSGDSNVSNRQERIQFQNLAREYGWLNCLRSRGVQQSVDDPPHLRKCRWIHISSKFTEYLEGVLFALSDWNSHPDTEMAMADHLRQLNQCIQENERFSKHGRYFTPFFEPLSEAKIGGPMLISVPFFDWSVGGNPPPLRFQIDRREGFQSSRGSSHLLRSILQHFYRLEDTSEREPYQVFTKHKPWSTDRNLDLKVRRWYGQYPDSLNVDELWILIVDSRHIVTFASNQTWKSRWPPLQFVSRVAEISFRAIRGTILQGDGEVDYTSYTHAIACLSGALGLLHRNFWTDLPPCLTARYVGFLSHLQYRLLRSPNASLVTDLMQVQDELSIIIQIMQQQTDLVENIQREWQIDGIEIASRSHSRASSTGNTRHTRHMSPPPRIIGGGIRYSFKTLSPLSLADPIKHLLENLRREHVDLCEVRDNCSILVTRTIQLVNIRLEDHGKSIMVFTMVTTIFLPLSFLSSYFGMNTIDIRNMNNSQVTFWIYAMPTTIIVVGIAIVLAAFGGRIWQEYINWRRKRKELRNATYGSSSVAVTSAAPAPLSDRVRTFELIGAGMR